ncbi:MAG: hypothetical protein KDE27_05110 [Planctomycetes bacterium]|nr:hypothetical protein [Planctomycetota bacterium]
MSRALPRPMLAAVVLAGAMLSAQHAPLGLGRAYLDEMAGQGRAIAIGPDVVAENLVPLMARIAEATNARRLTALRANDRTDPTLHAIRVDLRTIERSQRRAYMQLVDPQASRPAWPRGGSSDDLEIELFVQCRARRGIAAPLAPFVATGTALFGTTVAKQFGTAPCGDRVDSRRAYCLLALAEIETGGSLPCLLRALGEEPTPPSRPGTHQLLWLDVFSNWSRPRPESRGGFGPRPTGVPTTYVSGTVAQWRAALAACELCERSLDELQSWDETHGGARTTFFGPLHRQLATIRPACRTGVDLDAERIDAELRGPMDTEDARRLCALLLPLDQVGTTVDERRKPIARVAGREVEADGGPVVLFELAAADHRAARPASRTRRF